MCVQGTRVCVCREHTCVCGREHTRVCVRHKRSGNLRQKRAGVGASRSLWPISFAPPPAPPHHLEGLCSKLNNARARALARALDKPATARSRVEEMQVMTFDSCGNCRKAMAGPSPQLFRAMLSFLWASFVQ